MSRVSTGEGGDYQVLSTVEALGGASDPQPARVRPTRSPRFWSWHSAVTTLSPSRSDNEDFLRWPPGIPWPAVLRSGSFGSPERARQPFGQGHARRRRRRPQGRCFNGAALRAGRRLPVRNSLPSLPFSTTNSRDHQNRHIPGPVFNTYAVPRHHRSPPWHSEFSTLHARPGFRTARCRVISSHPITPTDPPTIPEIPRPCPRQCLAAPPRTSRSPIPQAIETSRNIPNPIALRPVTSRDISNPTARPVETSWASPTPLHCAPRPPRVSPIPHAQPRRISRDLAPPDPFEPIALFRRPAVIESRPRATLPPHRHARAHPPFTAQRVCRSRPRTNVQRAGLLRAFVLP